MKEKLYNNTGLSSLGIAWITVLTDKQSQGKVSKILKVLLCCFCSDRMVSVIDSRSVGSGSTPAPALYSLARHVFTLQVPLSSQV